jgi:glycosyltransferase involved in cell wall biosynthesis
MCGSSSTNRSGPPAGVANPTRDATRPLISIVTPCLNRARFVARAVESVLSQGYPRFEHILTDGGSTDGTLEVLGRYPHLRVVSEPDRSLYDAVNKGIRLARGDVIGFLNTDDYYAPDVFGRVAAAFASDPELDAVSGGDAFVEHLPDGAERETARYYAPGDVNLTIPALTNPISHINAHFFHRRVYERVGEFDLRYRIAADLDFLFRVARLKPKTAPLPVITYYYSRHAGSLTFAHRAGVPPSIAREVLSITERVLDRWELNGAERRAVQRLHSTTSGGALYYCWSRGWFGSGLRFAFRGLSRNPLWAACVSQAAGGMVRRLARGGTGVKGAPGKPPTSPAHTAPR